MEISKAGHPPRLLPMSHHPQEVLGRPAIPWPGHRVSLKAWSPPARPALQGVPGHDLSRTLGTNCWCGRSWMGEKRVLLPPSHQPLSCLQLSGEGGVLAPDRPLSCPQLSGSWHNSALASNNSALIKPGRTSGSSSTPWTQRTGSCMGKSSCMSPGCEAGSGWVGCLVGGCCLTTSWSDSHLQPSRLQCGLGHPPASTSHAQPVWPLITRPQFLGHRKDKLKGCAYAPCVQDGCVHTCTGERDCQCHFPSSCSLSCRQCSNLQLPGEPEPGAEAGEAPGGEAVGAERVGRRGPGAQGTEGDDWMLPRCLCPQGTGLV